MTETIRTEIHTNESVFYLCLDEKSIAYIISVMDEAKKNHMGYEFLGLTVNLKNLPDPVTVCAEDIFIDSRDHARIIKAMRMGEL